MPHELPYCDLYRDCFDINAPVLNARILDVHMLTVYALSTSTAGTLASILLPSLCF